MNRILTSLAVALLVGLPVAAWSHGGFKRAAEESGANARIFAADADNGDLIAIDLPSGEMVRRLSTPPYIMSLALSTDEQHLFTMRGRSTFRDFITIVHTGMDAETGTFFPPHVARTIPADIPGPGDKNRMVTVAGKDALMMEGTAEFLILDNNEFTGFEPISARTIKLAAPYHYFYLESEQGEAVIIAERQLSLEGTPNFRDLGGYETRDGRLMRWGRLYRSSKLSSLTESDIRYVNRLGVTLICDFRQVIEQELEPTWLGNEDSHVRASLPVAPGSSNSFIESLHNGIIAVRDSAGFMEEINRDFVVNQLPQYAEMFQLLLAGDQQLLIHCASGKDRTGFGAALILDVLGVSEEAIIEDYLLTNKYLPVDEEVERLSKEFADHKGSPVSEEVLRPMLEVRPEYIRACFEEIKQRYESKEHFFETALNLDHATVELLRSRYLH